MWKFPVLFLLGFLTFSVYAAELECLRYDSKHFIASTKWVPAGEVPPSDSLVSLIEDVYLLKLPNLKKHNFYNHVGIIVKAAGKTYQNHYFDCEAEKGRYYCRGECDSGQVWLDHKMRLRFEFVSYSKETMSGPETLLSLRPKDRKKWIEGKKVVCPEEVKQGKHVCYGKKEKGQYFYCERSQESCESIGKKHFGLYLDESSTRDALMRCHSSKPK